MKKLLTYAAVVVAAVCAAAGQVSAQAWKAHGVPLFVSASHPSGYEGFVRVINHSDEAGEVLIDAVDDEGVPYGPVTLSIGAGETVHFNSGDLEEGNADKGLSRGIGAGDGDWRLRLRSQLDLEVLAYNRTSDGLLAPLHDLVPSAVVRRPSTGEEAMGHRVVIFNPASNVNQVSRLRIVNRGEEEATVTIEGIDDDGVSPGTAVELEVASGASHTVTAEELESGEGAGLGGMLDDGQGKWQLVVTADQPIEVMSLLSSPTGHLTNLSTEPEAGEGDAAGEHDVPLFAAADNADRYQGFVRIINRSGMPGEVLVEAFDDDGIAYTPVALDIDAHETVHFNSGDLEQGNAGKGLMEGVGSGGIGDWRLVLRSDLDIEVLAYNRTDDGLLTTLHDLVPYTEVVRPGGEEVPGHHVAIFNPASNENQVSRLRVINPGEVPATVVIEGIDDAGASPGTAVELTVPARASHTVTSQALESGQWHAGVAASGGLGDGKGKWRLAVTSEQAIGVMSLLSNPTGHLVNLSTVAADTQSDIVPGEILRGSIDSPDDVDRFRLRVTEPGMFTFTFSSDPPGVKVSLLDYRGHVLAVAETAVAGEQDDAGSVRAGAEPAHQERTVTEASDTCTDRCVMEVLLDVGEYLIHVAISGELVGPLVSQIVWGLLLDVDATGQKDPVRITPGAPFEGRCRCLAILEPGESREVHLANFFESPVGSPLRFGPLGEIPAGLLVNLYRATGRLTISAPEGTDLGIYRFGLQVDDVETSLDVVAEVNVSATPQVRAGQSLTIRATAGRETETSIDLSDVIGPPEHIGNHQPIRFHLYIDTPEERASVRRLQARIESARLLKVHPSSDLKGEFSLRLGARFPNGESELDFTLRVIVVTNETCVEDEVDIQDAGLRTAVARALNKKVGEPISGDEMALLKTLGARDRNIRDLTGLECASGLKTLLLDGNQISGLSSLSGLTSLEYLTLYSNRISNLSPLSGLTALKNLQLFDNQVSNLSPLSGLTALEVLGLSDNQISNVSPLSGLTALEHLGLSDNQISNVSPLSRMTRMTHLRLRNNQISNLSPLSRMTHLRSLFLGDNRISNVSPLSGLTALDFLSLFNNRISNIGPLVSNSGLRRGDNLSLFGNPLNDRACSTHIPALERRGVSVTFFGCPDESDRSR